MSLRTISVKISSCVRGRILCHFCPLISKAPGHKHSICRISCRQFCRLYCRHMNLLTACSIHFLTDDVLTLTHGSPSQRHKAVYAGNQLADHHLPAAGAHGSGFPLHLELHEASLNAFSIISLSIFSFCFSVLLSVYRTDGFCRDAFLASDKSQPFGCCRFNIDPTLTNPQYFCDVFPHRFDMDRSWVAAP